MLKEKGFFSLRKMVIIALLGAISVVLGMTPIGFIPVGPTRATIMHIPVIIGAIMEGPIVGAFVGLIFGLFSIYQALTTPTPVSFVFLFLFLWGLPLFIPLVLFILVKRHTRIIKNICVFKSIGIHIT